MSWLYQGAEVRSDDWRLVDFKPVQCTGLTAFRSSTSDGQENQSCNSGQSTANHHHGPKNSVCCRNLPLGEDINKWLHEASYPDGIKLIVGGKTPCLDELPFNRDVFINIKSRLTLHGSIIRVLHRSFSCHFSATVQGFSENGASAKHIIYNCRTSSSWAGDMALCMTFFPDKLTTNALWLGCTPSEGSRGYQVTDAQLVRRRLSEFDGEAFHPLLLPTLLADMERDRLVRQVRDLETSHIQKVFDLQYKEAQSLSLQQSSPSYSYSSNPSSPSPGLIRCLADIFRDFGKKLIPSAQSRRPELEEMAMPLGTTPPRIPLASDGEPSIQLYIKISHLRNGLDSWRAQLVKMIEHVDELQRIDFGMTATIHNNYEAKASALNALTETGHRIRSRLAELVDEHGEFIRKCTHITEVIGLNTQLELAHITREDARLNQQIASVNLEVAKLARRDANLMKSITLLGMIFLPGTFVATFFSMDFFDWPIQEDQWVSSYIWVYVVITFFLTSLCLGIFYLYILRR